MMRAHGIATNAAAVRAKITNRVKSDPAPGTTAGPKKASKKGAFVDHNTADDDEEEVAGPGSVKAEGEIKTEAEGGNTERLIVKEEQGQEMADVAYTGGSASPRGSGSGAEGGMEAYRYEMTSSPSIGGWGEQGQRAGYMDDGRQFSYTPSNPYERAASAVFGGYHQQQQDQGYAAQFIDLEAQAYQENPIVIAD
jgi:hypothetical protein